MENDKSTALENEPTNAQQQPPYYGGDLTSNALRMPCSNIATTSSEACTACCKMACRHYTISLASFHVFLILIIDAYISEIKYKES